MNYDIPDKKKPRKDLEDEDQRKCYPKRGTNIMPYQKIEFELRKDAHVWPPITKPPHVDANNMPTSMSAARLTDMVVRASNEHEMSRSTPSLKQNGGGGSFKKQLSSTSTANHHHPAPIKTMTGSSPATTTTTAAKQQLLNSNSIELDDFYITKI